MGQEPKPSGSALSGGLGKGPPIDLAEEGKKVSLKSRPGREIDLKTVIPEAQIIVLKNDHQLKMMIVLTVCLVAASLSIAVSVAFVLSSGSDRIELLKAFQPYFMAILALAAGGAAGGAAVRQFKK